MLLHVTCDFENMCVQNSKSGNYVGISTTVAVARHTVIPLFIEFIDAMQLTICQVFNHDKSDIADMKNSTRANHTVKLNQCIKFLNMCFECISIISHCTIAEVSCVGVLGENITFFFLL